jgi:hypothetical protein
MQVEQPASRDRARQGVRWLEVGVAGWQRARRCGSRLVDIAVFAAVRSWLAGGAGALDLFCARPLPLGFGLFCKAWKPAGFVARWVRDAAAGGSRVSKYAAREALSSLGMGRWSGFKRRGARALQACSLPPLYFLVIGRVAAWSGSAHPELHAGERMRAFK